MGDGHSDPIAFRILSTTIFQPCRWDQSSLFVTLSSLMKSSLPKNLRVEYITKHY
jgi:hypothetical protein